MCFLPPREAAPCSAASPRPAGSDAVPSYRTTAGQARALLGMALFAVRVKDTQSRRFPRKGKEK